MSTVNRSEWVSFHFKDRTVERIREREREKKNQREKVKRHQRIADKHWTDMRVLFVVVAVNLLGFFIGRIGSFWMCVPQTRNIIVSIAHSTAYNPQTWMQSISGASERELDAVTTTPTSAVYWLQIGKLKNKNQSMLLAVSRLAFAGMNSLTHIRAYAQRTCRHVDSVQFQFKAI